MGRYQDNRVNPRKGFALNAVDPHEQHGVLPSNPAEQENSAAAEQLATQDAQVRELTTRIGSQQAREIELLKNLKEREAQIAKLLAISAAQEEWARELAGLFAKQEATLERIYASTSWRITSPVRKITRKFPRLMGLARECAKLVWWVVRGQFWRIPEAKWPRVKHEELGASSNLHDARAIQEVQPSDIVLYTSYYKASESERQREIDFCLAQNVACKAISRIIVLVEGGEEIPTKHPKITVVPNAGRLTYGRWIDLSQELPPATISVLANSDIYFDETIAGLSDALLDDLSFVALTRRDRFGSTFRPHPNPLWSQDVWAFKTDSPISESLRASLDIPLGVPRCDNKIAYLFAVHGWKIVNPTTRIFATHVHETQARTYEKLTDASVVGAVAYVCPSDPFNNAARLEFDIWTLNGPEGRPVPVGYTRSAPGYIRSASRSQTAIKKQLPDSSRLKIAINAQTEANKPVRGIPPVLDISPLTVSSQPSSPADSHFWQYPCLTEKEAFDRHLSLVEGSNVDLDQHVFHTYLGLPWATYIDRKSDFQDLVPLIHARVDQARAYAQSHGFELAVHTVCQHYAWWRIGGVFTELGVTDLHLSHCTSKAKAYFYGLNIRVHSWPLYAVNIEDPQRRAGLQILKPTSEKRYLASFIGSYMTHYLSDVRLRLAEAAQRDGGPDLLIELSDQWHFNPVVYDEQVKRKSINRRIVKRHAEATHRYNQVLSDSVFSICPEGAGPNSLRLWESLAVGSIPVAIFDDWEPPHCGHAKIGLDEACIVLPTTEIDDLFHTLRNVSPSEIETRRQICVDYYKSMKTHLCFPAGVRPLTSEHPSHEPKAAQSL